jgi:hypothetical protein
MSKLLPKLTIHKRQEAFQQAITQHGTETNTVAVASPRAEPAVATSDLDSIISQTKIDALSRILEAEGRKPLPPPGEPFYLKQEYLINMHTTWDSACVGNGQEWKVSVEGWAMSLDSRGFVMDAHAAASINNLSPSRAISGSCEQIAEHIVGQTLRYYADNPFLCALRVTLTRNSKVVQYTWRESMPVPRSQCAFGEAGTQRGSCGVRLDPQISG